MTNQFTNKHGTNVEVEPVMDYNNSGVLVERGGFFCTVSKPGKGHFTEEFKTSDEAQTWGANVNL